MEQFTSDGLINGNGEDWWHIRSKAQQPLLRDWNAEYHLSVLGNIASDFIDRIKSIRQENNEMKPDFVNEMYNWALECKTSNTILNSINKHSEG